MLDLLLTNSADEQKSKGCFVLDVEGQMEYVHRVSEMQYFSEFRLGLAPGQSHVRRWKNVR